MLAEVEKSELITGTNHDCLEGWERLSICPWQWRPFRLLRLMEMLRFYASRFFELVEFMNDMAGLFEQNLHITSLTPSQIGFLQQKFALLRSQLAEMNLAVSINSIERLIEAGKITTDVSVIRDLLRHITLTIKDEMESVLFLQVAHHLSGFYQSKEPLFGETVHTNFPSAIIDIEEAGNCLSLGRNAACVFHLMRVMETGLRLLGKSLNDPSLDPRTNPTWERILRRCDNELQKPYGQRSAEWRTDQQFFSEATANLRAVKDAWRNPTLHIEMIYDEERAMDVWNAVKLFMRHLATKLSEQSLIPRNTSSGLYQGD